MQGRNLTRGMKLEAVKLITERGVKVAQVGQDLVAHPTQLRQGFCFWPGASLSRSWADEARAG
jgi:hypothetical protein